MHVSHFYFNLPKIDGKINYIYNVSNFFEFLTVTILGFMRYFKNKITVRRIFWRFWLHISMDIPIIFSVTSTTESKINKRVKLRNDRRYVKDSYGSRNYSDCNRAGKRVLIRSKTRYFYLIIFYIADPSLGPEPIRMVCPICRQQIITLTDEEPTNEAYLCSMLAFILG